MLLAAVDDRISDCRGTARIRTGIGDNVTGCRPAVEAAVKFGVETGIGVGASGSCGAAAAQGHNGHGELGESAAQFGQSRPLQLPSS